MNLDQQRTGKLEIAIARRIPVSRWPSGRVAEASSIRTRNNAAVN